MKLKFPNERAEGSNPFSRSNPLIMKRINNKILGRTLAIAFALVYFGALIYIFITA